MHKKTDDGSLKSGKVGSVDVSREDHEVFDDYLELVIQYGSVRPIPSPCRPFLLRMLVHKGRGAGDRKVCPRASAGPGREEAAVREDPRRGPFVFMTLFS